MKIWSWWQMTLQQEVEITSSIPLCSQSSNTFESCIYLNNLWCIHCSQTLKCKIKSIFSCWNTAYNHTCIPMHTFHSFNSSAKSEDLKTYIFTTKNCDNMSWKDTLPMQTYVPKGNTIGYAVFSPDEISHCFDVLSSFAPTFKCH